MARTSAEEGLPASESVNGDLGGRLNNAWPEAVQDGKERENENREAKGSGASSAACCCSTTIGIDQRLC